MRKEIELTFETKSQKFEENIKNQTRPFTIHHKYARISTIDPIALNQY